MSNIRDVARLAGVSIGTVSRVLNNSGPVKDSTRQRVSGAVAALGYVPNPLAQGMRTGRSQSVGLLVPSLTHPFFTELVTAVEKTCNDAGHTLMICSAREDDRLELSHLRTLANRQIDGLLISPVSGHPETIKGLLTVSKTLPVVLIDRVVEQVGFSTIAVDGYQGVSDAVRYLAAKGHRRIAYIGFPANRVVGLERRRGYLDAMQTLGLPVTDGWIAEGDTQIAGGYACTQRFLALADRPTALVASNDMMAIGAIRAAKDAGLSIPGDVAVVGFDGITLGQLVDPPLTTVAQPIEEIGVEAASLVLQKFTAASSRAEHLVLRTRLVVRASA